MRWLGFFNWRKEEDMKKISIISIVLIISFVFYGMALADLNDGLVAYYPFNGNANDESGNANDGYQN